MPYHMIPNPQMTQFQNYVCPHKEQQDLVYHHTFHKRFLNPTKFLWQNTWSEFPQDSKSLKPLTVGFTISTKVIKCKFHQVSSNIYFWVILIWNLHQKTGRFNGNLRIFWKCYGNGWSRPDACDVLEVVEVLEVKVKDLRQGWWRESPGTKTWCLMFFLKGNHQLIHWLLQKIDWESLG